MGKVANASLDALDARALGEDLPGVQVAFDRDAMRGLLQSALVGPRGSAEVRSCGLTSAILLDGRCVSLRYELGVENADGRVESALVTARVYPNADLAVAYQKRLAPLAEQARGRAETASFTAPVAVVEALRMVVHAFPIDGELPTLVAATDPAVAGRAIQGLLADGGSRARVEGCRAEPVHYNRRHRCMLRYHLDLAGGKKLVVYGKVAADGAGADTPAVVDALRSTLLQAGVSVPKCLGFSEDLQLVTFSEIPGVPRVAQLLKARLRGEPPAGGLTVEEAVDVCGRIAAGLHTSRLRLGAPRPLEVELMRLRAELAPIRRLSPRLASRLAEWMDAVEARAAETRALQARQCHGDFSYTQLIFDGPRAGLVDFDNFCQAEPALDLGQFLAYLHYAGLKARGHSADERAGLSESLSQQFTTSYVAAGGPSEALERVGIYEAVNLIRMAEHAWQNLKADRLDNVVTLLGERLSLDP
jgi:hypothetical protein